MHIVAQMSCFLVFLSNPAVTAFRKQCKELISSLGRREAHYIRCVKSNPEAEAGEFSVDLVSQQVRYHGILEHLKLRRYVHQNTGM